jgi:DnaK suppressor protein
MADTTELDELARRLDAVEAAMARLDAGSYGSCEDCGATLDDERLASDPAQLRCADCVQTRRDG